MKKSELVKIIKEAVIAKRALKEETGNLRSQLHTLVGNEMRLGKRVGMTGASHHEEEHKKAEKAVEDFLKMNPSMEEYRDEVEDHFTKLLFKEGTGDSLDQLMTNLGDAILADDVEAMKAAGLALIAKAKTTGSSLVKKGVDKIKKHYGAEPEEN